ncbi:MAG: SprT family zinc-dependent metalloprotease [Saprospiraceae bacterium]|jgi:hypothetical protein
MFGRNKKAPASQKFRTTIMLEGQELPVTVYMERRLNTRFSISRKGISLRIPGGQGNAFVQAQLYELKEWLRVQVQKKPQLLAHFTPKTYSTGQTLQVGDRKYWIELKNSDRATSVAKLVGETICLDISNKADKFEEEKTIKTLLSRIVANDYLPEITARVEEINQRTFRQKINGVFLKYNHSNWGSCSINGNVNLSTRLLFAPRPVQDYVILHELAHLIEMNHSDRYWALVERFMPDYRDKELWLKNHGKSCDF